MRAPWAPALGATLILTLFLAEACSQQPSYDDPREFIEAFVQALRENDEGRYGEFYVRRDDFEGAPSAGARVAVNRISGPDRESFLAGCRGAAALLRGREVSIEGIEFGGARPRVAALLRGVLEHRSQVLVHLRAGEMTISLLIPELIRLEGGWRLTGVRTIVDVGSERLPARTITLEEEPPPEEDAQPDSSR